MNIDHQLNEGVDILHLTGKLDATCAPSVEEKFSALSKGGAAGLVVDLADVEYVSSAGLRALILGVKTYASVGKPFFAANPLRDVADVIELTGVDKVLKITSSVDEAVAKFQA